MHGYGCNRAIWWWLRPRLEALLELPGVVGAHLCAADTAASSIQTEEKKGRPRDAMPGWVLLVEAAGDDPRALTRDPGFLQLSHLQEAGASGPVEMGWYRLQVMQLPPAGR